MLGVLMARNLLIVWLINALALLALLYFVPSVQVDSIYTALVAAALLGLVNTLIRPLLVLLTLPATVLTLGLFIFVITVAGRVSSTRSGRISVLTTPRRAEEHTSEL